MSSTTADVRIVVNGEDRRVAGGQTVADWLSQMDRDPRSVAIEINGSIAPRTTYGRVVLNDGDCLEVVHFVQGG